MTYSVTNIVERTICASFGRRKVAELEAANWLVDWIDNQDGTITIWFKLTINS